MAKPKTLNIIRCVAALAPLIAVACIVGFIDMLATMHQCPVTDHQCSTTGIQSETDVRTTTFS